MGDKLPTQMSNILRWYRKGLVTIYLEEKLIYWVTAMEGTSELIESQGDRVVDCPKCKNKFSIGPSASKNGLLKFIKENLGLSRSKIYDPIWKARSKYVHGVNSEVNIFDPGTRILVDATKALVEASISFYLFNNTNIHFNKSGEFTGFNYQHPIFGYVKEWKEKLELLANSR